MDRPSSPLANETRPAANVNPASQDKAAGRQGPSLTELKREVLALAKVSTTKELKHAQSELRTLDFRRKASWASALALLREARESRNWHANPPEEFRELFTEIDAASASYARSIDKGLRLSQELERAADDLEALAEELQGEAGELRSVRMAATGQARARRLN
jgi:hypothetical protein